MPKALTPEQKRARRDAEIRAMHHAGHTLSKIGRKFGLTDARVWQIVHGYRSTKPQPVGDEDA